MNECYIDIFYEISKNTPIVGIIQSNSRTFLAALKSYLDNEVDVFDDIDMLNHLNDEIPVIVNMMAAVRKYENETFLPKPIESLFNYMIDLYAKVHKTANERFVKAGSYEAEEPPTEFFPGLPLHSEQKLFKVDSKELRDDESFGDECNKDYPTAPKITPGLAHIFCRHKICKGFTAMTSSENPQMFIKILTRRLPQTSVNFSVSHVQKGGLNFF